MVFGLEKNDLVKEIFCAMKYRIIQKVFQNRYGINNVFDFFTKFFLKSISFEKSKKLEIRKNNGTADMLILLEMMRLRISKNFGTTKPIISPSYFISVR
jgi:hypothetical protein